MGNIGRVAVIAFAALLASCHEREQASGNRGVNTPPTPSAEAWSPRDLREMLSVSGLSISIGVVGEVPASPSFTIKGPVVGINPASGASEVETDVYVAPFAMERVVYLQARTCALLGDDLDLSRVAQYAPVYPRYRDASGNIVIVGSGASAEPVYHARSAEQTLVAGQRVILVSRCPPKSRCATDPTCHNPIVWKFPIYSGASDFSRFGGSTSQEVNSILDALVSVARQIDSDLDAWQAKPSSDSAN